MLRRATAGTHRREELRLLNGSLADGNMQRRTKASQQVNYAKNSDIVGAELVAWDAL